MKRAILVLLLCAFAAMNAFTFDEARQILDRQNDHLRNMATCSCSRFEVVPAYIEMYPIAYSFYEIYFNQGFDQAEIYDWEGGAWVLVGDITLVYEGGVVTQMQFPIDETSMRFFLTWSGGHIVESLQQIQMEGQWMDFMKETYTFGRENLSSMLRQMYMAGTWLDYELFTWTYSGDQVTECLIQLNNTTNWMDEARMTATWDRNNITQVVGEYYSETWETNYRDTYTYNESGQCLTDLYEYYEQDVWVNEDNDTYTYTGGYLEQVFTEEWEEGAWVNRGRTTFSYAGGGFTEQLEEEWDGEGWVNDTKIVATGFDVDDENVAPVTSVNAYPNPFNPEITVAFSLAAPQDVNVRVFDVRGRLTATLHSGALDAGNHKMVWNGLDSDGAAVASGVYLMRVETPQGVHTTKATLLK